jgi:uncharacterized membrane protein
MPDFFTAPAVQAGFALLILCILIVAAFYLVSIFRDYADEDRENTAEALANLQEMHLKGDINDQEFRTIKATTHRHPVGPKTIDDSTPPDDSSPDTRN